MTVQQILTPVINQEFQKYQSMGIKIRLKSTNKLRGKYSLICGGAALWSLLLSPLILLIVIPIYIVLMIRANDNVRTILSVAKDYPDKPIDVIVAEEIQR